MTRRETVARAGVVALAAAGGVTLLWCAWRVLTAPLPTTAAAAAWTLWVVAVAALLTFVLYLSEMTRHGLPTSRASWKPLPGLVLLWVGGLTALVAFGFVLPDRPGETAQSDGATASTTATTTSPPTPSPTGASATSAAARRTAAATVEQATSRPSPVSTSSAVRTTSRKATPAATSTSTSPTPSTTTTTTEPLIDITLPGKGRRPTGPPPSR